MQFLSQTSRSALGFAIGLAAFAGTTVLFSPEARAACTVVGAAVQCAATSTVNTAYPTSPPNDRSYSFSSPSPAQLTIDTGAAVSGFGLAISNTGTGGVTVTNNGAISVGPGNTPTAGGTAALSMTAASGPITYTGGPITNNGAGNALDVTQNGAGIVDINVSGAVFAVSGDGIKVANTTAGGEIKVTTGTVAGQVSAINVHSLATAATAHVTIVANGDVFAGGDGIVGSLMTASATANVDITTNGLVQAASGITAENYGSGSTTVNAVGPISATTGNGVFVRNEGGNVSVTTGAVSSTGNEAIIARQVAVGSAATAGVTTNGNVSGTTGIVAANYGTGGIKIVTNGTVTGTSAEGIVSVANGGAVDVQIAGTVTGATHGISLSANGAGNISLTGAGAIVGGTGDAANIRNFGFGMITVNLSGASSSTGGNGIVVRDTATGGNINVTTGSVTALAAGKNGIDVESLSSSANISIVANGAVRAGNTGISATSSAGDILVTSGDVTSTGSWGINAQQTLPAGGGNIGVTANGNVSGVVGILAQNLGTGTVNVKANGTVTGTSFDGITAIGNNAVDVQVAGTVTGGARGLTLIGGSGGTGNISVAGTGGFVGGTSDAVSIRNDGSGTITVNISGASSSTAGNGILVRDTTTAGGAVSVTTGAVTALTAGKNGIDVQSVSAAGNMTIVANGAVRAGGAGIYGTIAAGGAGNIDITANGAIDASDGIYAGNLGTGTTTVKAVGPITATTRGVYAYTTGGNVSVTTGAVTSLGDTAISAYQGGASAGTVNVMTNGNVSGTRGIIADNSGSGTVSVIANGAVTGTSVEGIVAFGRSAVDVQVAGTVTGATRGLSLVGGTGGAGNISVTGAGGFVGGTDDAVNIKNNGSGTITVNISGASSSTAGHGILVADTAAGGDISVTTGAVTALGNFKRGIEVQSQSTVANVTIVANGDVKADGIGILGSIAAGGTGNTAITANGAVEAISGIFAYNFGTGTTTVNAVGPITTSAYGIIAQGLGGAISVTTNAVTTTGGDAISVLQIGGAIDVTTNGDVSGTTGIVASNSGTGTISVLANRAVTGTAYEGILLLGTSGTTVDVQVAGTVMGATRGIRLISVSGTIANLSSGTIRNSSGLTTDEAIQAAGGSFMLANAGNIIGTVSFGTGADSFVNAGTWRTAGGTSDFGGGGDTLRNTASGVIDAAGAAAVAATTFNNLALFVNEGRLSMVNGIAGDMLTTSGNAQFVSGSVYAIDINSGVSDRFIVLGSAQLAGTLAVSVSGSIGAPGTRYTVLTASGGVSGRFDAVTGAAFLTLRDSYDANNAYLDVVQRAFAQAAVTPNQIATANGLESMPTSGSLYNAILHLATDAQARNAFDQLSGEAHASLSTVLAEDSRFIRTGALDRLRSAFDAPGATRVPVMSYAPGGPTSVRLAPVERFAIWGQAYGSWGRWNGDGNAARLNRSTGGFAVGVDTPDFGTPALPVRVGLLAGYSNTGFSVGNRSSSGSSDNFHMGAYAGAQWNAFGLRAGVVHSWHDIRTTRSVVFMGFTDMLRGNYDARTTQVFGDLGYRIDAGRFGFEPFANLAYVNLRTNGFREMGGAAALTSQGRTSSVTFSTLGLRASSQFDLGGMALTARGTLGWRHAFGAVTPQAVFAFAGGAPFTISGIAIARDAAVVEAGLDLQITPAATLGVSYSGQFARAANDQSLKGNLAVKF